MKPEQRPTADDTREPKNASPRRVPLNVMLGIAAATLRRRLALEQVKQFSAQFQ